MSVTAGGDYFLSSNNSILTPPVSLFFRIFILITAGFSVKWWLVSNFAAGNTLILFLGHIFPQDKKVHWCMAHGQPSSWLQHDTLLHFRANISPWKIFVWSLPCINYY